MAGNKTVKPATRSKEQSFIYATKGLRGLLAGMVRPILGIPEPKHQR